MWNIQKKEWTSQDLSLTKKIFHPLSTVLHNKRWSYRWRIKKYSCGILKVHPWYCVKSQGSWHFYIFHLSWIDFGFAEFSFGLSCLYVWASPLILWSNITGNRFNHWSQLKERKNNCESVNELRVIIGVLSWLELEAILVMVDGTGEIKSWFLL